ncbi:hypothetical protein ABI59_21490 [Acidobacteria bacterium Mor1]|nr:hypothetical protein ABI59_21490 [Acidobacteria bacterium Mor1]
MDHAELMQESQRAQRLIGQSRKCLGTLLGDGLNQVRAVDPLHGEVGSLVGRRMKVEDSDEVGVAQRAQKTELRAKLVETLRLGTEESLQRQAAPGLQGVLNEPDFTCPTFTQATDGLETSGKGNGAGHRTSLRPTPSFRN